MAARTPRSDGQVSLFGDLVDAGPDDPSPVESAPESNLAVPGARRSGASASSSVGTSATLYCDGGSRGNPGPAAIGAVLFANEGSGPSGAHGTVRLAEVSETIGIATNNVAEYRALLGGLDAAAVAGVRNLTVRLDSKLLVEQVNGNFKVKHPNLKPLHAEAVRSLKRFDRVVVEHVRREFNTDADALVNRALDAPRTPGIR